MLHSSVGFRHNSSIGMLCHMTNNAMNPFKLTVFMLNVVILSVVAPIIATRNRAVFVLFL